MLISVVIPVFNAQEYIENTVDSVINQEYKNWELIIIDDCSTDDSLSIVETKYKSNKKIEIIKLERNSGGPAKPRNIGIKNSNGDFIAFLDQDDIWDNDKLRICCNSICDNVDFIYHDMRVVAENDYSVKQKILPSRQLEQPVLIDLLINDNAILNSSTMVRRSLLVKIGDINESKKMIASEDYNTWLRIAKITDNFLYIPKVLGSIFVHSSGASNKDMYSSVIYAAKEFMTYVSPRQRRIIKVQRVYVRARYKYLNNERGAAVKALLFFCLNYGDITIKIKSAYMLLSTAVLSIIRKITRNKEVVFK
jgi:glycosyltransferase involved in cell wall biosynthesis